MIDFLRQLFGRRTAPSLRLSERDALTLARVAAAAHPMVDTLAIATSSVEEGMSVWQVRSATVGKMLVVTIDDATGAATSMRESGIR